MVAMHPDAMERLELFRGDIILLKVRTSARFHPLGPKIRGQASDLDADLAVLVVT
jgi:hypothetical protein